MNSTNEFIPVDALATGFSGKNNTLARAPDLDGQERTSTSRTARAHSFTLNEEGFIRWGQEGPSAG